MPVPKVSIENTSRKLVSRRPQSSTPAQSRVTECTGASLAAVTTWSTQNMVRSQIIEFNLSNVLEFYFITGRTNSPLLRLLPAAYESGTLPRGGLVDSTLPSARTVRKVECE